MKNYLIHVVSGVLCLGGISMCLFAIFFDAEDIEKVRGQQHVVQNPVVIPVGGLPPLHSSCDELFFCKHPCTTPNGSGLDCLDYCSPGQELGDSCMGANNATGVCVGVCSSSYNQGAVWTTCGDQPSDSVSCPVGNTCLGFIPAQTATGAVCTGGCGFLDMSTGSVSTVLTTSTPGLCEGGTRVVTGLLISSATGWNRSCGSLDPLLTGTSSCMMHIYSGSTFTLTGTLGTTGAYAQVNVCGSVVTSNANGVFSRSGIANGTNCASITAKKLDHTCTISTQGPSSLVSNIHNVVGSCIPTANRGGSKTTVGTSGTGTADSYAHRFSNRLRTALDRFESSCAYTDVDYREVIFQDIQRNPDQEAIKTLQAYCIVKGYTYTHNTKYHADAATSVGEAIKTLVKIAAMDDGVSFDEFGWHTGRLPYSDMLPNAWYTPYVVYAHDKGYLDGVTGWKVFGLGELKALTPITKKQFAQLLENFGKESAEHYALYMRPGKWVMRDEMAAVIVDMFADELVDYRYLYGNNTVFYRRLLQRLEKSSNQQAYLTKLVTNLKTWDADMMGWKYNLDVDGIIAFLEEILDQ